MIKKFIIHCLSLSVLSLWMPGVSFAVPASPQISEVVQPDGTVIKVKIKGDEWNHRIETVEGYVVNRAKSGKWHYISRYEGDTPILSDTLANELPKPDFQRHIRPSPNFRKANPNSGLTQSPAVNALSTPSAAPFGTFNGKILFILAEFTDREGTYSETSFASLLSNKINDYFKKASYGKVNLQPANESFGTLNNGVIGWVNLGYAHPDTGGNIGNQNQKITKDAVAAADPYINYASFDINGDGYVDSNELAIVVIVAGYERSYSANYTPSVWGHKWSVTSPPKLDGVIVGADHNGAGGYAQFGEIHRGSSSDAHQATMGIMVHEMGHLIFALPDLYDTDYSSEGIGYFSVMAAGSWGKSASNSYWGESP
ncbi:MAG: M6 family metalloprotease domain-containing protein, partial [Nitrospirae bacterium]|nr:M6 family metalloprotease domain-containing protein [Nitrospirota bacterium]